MPDIRTGKRVQNHDYPVCREIENGIAFGILEVEEFGYRQLSENFREVKDIERKQHTGRDGDYRNYRNHHHLHKVVPPGYAYVLALNVLVSDERVV